MIEFSGTPTLEEFLAQAHAYRVAIGDAEATFFEYLYKAETDWQYLWSATGHTYEQFLDSHKLCNVARYREWLKSHGFGITRYVREVGLEPVLAAPSLKTPKQREELIERARVFKETNGVTMSEKSAQREARDIRMREAAVKTAVRGRSLGYSELAAKCQRLEIENAELREINQALRAENMILKQQCDGLTTPPKARRSRNSAVSE